MIHTGISLAPNVTPELFRLLANHPDIEIDWISRNAAYADDHFFDSLQGELDRIRIADTPDFDGLDLYIGPYTPLADIRPEIKCIFTDISGCSDSEHIVQGICELNRKTFVRGATRASLPSVSTMLGALAMMPLAKNLMLNSKVTGTMLLPARTPRSCRFLVPAHSLDDADLAPLRSILVALQNSFSSVMQLSTVETSATPFACAILTIDLKITAEQALSLFHEFYDDHRHIFLTGRDITDRMVEDTNKTVIGMRNDSSGRLVVSVGFDARYKGAAGNIVHILNLMFGLDERTGF